MLPSPRKGRHADGDSLFFNAAPSPSVKISFVPFYARFFVCALWSSRLHLSNRI
ncbi:hypothetical protein IAD21_03366 [Abditibacteriota bacterium]|nr:hypothetical protein IAD21_03366 [Abditibacteriota bacterium]